ncbi:hypothetical protein C9J03_11905 [Photobacterium gaetbulicola]|uniref:Uncharacterized protein n=1 Tax=Photobacterium gaetbulicola Gung47 TaxID=658445 RepID=A0A0C5X013_9GAMM|nr:hypothetical protein [Photobacterium gaetbulicola]AJR08660.1 hypothetical protein H744_2c1996 [Photobacterium gaetbulicola Gung47]PSU10288.1 hypothetical protein C9J03_11905 [Photobacterium gaetbulicola]
MAESMPVRASANKVEGINRCECGNVRTIHRARGKRSKYLYAICDDCGTNQQTGKYWQSRFEQHYPTIEALHQAEQAAPVVESEGEPESNIEPELPEPETESVVAVTDVEPQPSQTEPEPETQSDAKPSGWKSVIAGVVLGALTGGMIARF